MNYVEAMRLDDVSASISSDWLCLRDFAKIHAGLGNKEKPWNYYSSVLNSGSGSSFSLKLKHSGITCGDDPKFVELLKKVGFEE